MEQINPVWDYIDDYAFSVVNEIEINIRAYNESDLHLWAFNHKVEEELVDDDYSSLSLLQIKINEILGAEVILPKIEDLLKITRNEK